MPSACHRAWRATLAAYTTAAQSDQPSRRCPAILWLSPFLPMQQQLSLHQTWMTSKIPNRESSALSGFPLEPDSQYHRSCESALPTRSQFADILCQRIGGAMTTAGADQDAHTATIAFFDDGAGDYVTHASSERDFAERFALFGSQIAIARQRLGATPVCLDLGCGPGTLALLARKEGFSVLGIDGSSSMLAHARALADRQHLDIDFRHASLPLAEPEAARLEDSADLIVASSVIEYLPDDDLFARQCHRLLAPGGIGLVSLANSHSVYRAIERSLAGSMPRRGSYLTVQARQHDKEHACEIFRRAGLDVESAHYFGLPRPLYTVWRSARRPPWLATLFLLVLRRPRRPVTSTDPRTV